MKFQDRLKNRRLQDTFCPDNTHEQTDKGKTIAADTVATCKNLKFMIAVILTIDDVIPGSEQKDNKTTMSNNTL